MVGFKSRKGSSQTTAKALLEGDYVAHLPDGTIFGEASFKAEHPSVELALSERASTVINKRRWAKIEDGKLTRSDDATFDLTMIRFEKVK